MTSTLDRAALRSLFLFESLEDDRLDALLSVGTVVSVPAGVVYAEGSPGTCCYVLLSGTIAVVKRSGQQDVELNRTDRRGVYCGALNGFYGDPAPAPYLATLRAVTPCTFLVVDAACMAELVRTWFPMAVHLIRGAVDGMRSTTAQLGQRERLLALGTLSAGLTHELNNPASAAVAGLSALRSRLDAATASLASLPDPSPVLALRPSTVEPVGLSPLQLAEAEDSLASWLDEHGVADGWELAPVLAGAGLDVAWASSVLSSVGAAGFPAALRWLAYTVDSAALMREIDDAVRRISRLVGAAAQYAQLDRAPLQEADLHTLLDSTLAMLGSRLAGVSVVRSYDPDLPCVPVRGAELNQAWTNIIDNAIRAMPGGGVLTVRTALDRDRVLVEIGDTGPGIPAELQSRVFEPFFTTRPVGEGSGLGLEIAWRIVVDKHRGDLRVVSSPGDTRFRVWLPLSGG